MRFLVTAEAADAPGVVAAVTAGIASREWHVEDASMARLAGRFVMLLVIETPPGVVANTIVQAMREKAMFFALRIAVDEIHHAPEPADGVAWVVSMEGPERPGVISATSEALARHAVNIDDLITRRINERPVTYRMTVEVTVPPDLDQAAFLADMEAVARSLDVTCSVRRMSEMP